MSEIVITRTVNAPLEQVWASWDDFGNIYKFSPAIASSTLLGNRDVTTRVGTRRECEFNDGRNWVRERVTRYEEGRLLALEVYEGSIPVRKLEATLEFEKLGDDLTRVTMSAAFEPKGGVFGKLIVPLMKRQFRQLLGALLDENAVYVENGLRIQKAA